MKIEGRTAEQRKRTDGREEGWQRGNVELTKLCYVHKYTTVNSPFMYIYKAPIEKDTNKWKKDSRGEEGGQKERGGKAVALGIETEKIIFCACMIMSK